MLSFIPRVHHAPLLTAALLALTALPAAAAPTLQPGLYDISVRIVMKGMGEFSQKLSAKRLGACK